MGQEREPDPGQSGQSSEDLGCQQKVERFSHKVFGGWGTTVATHPCKVFWLSLLLLLICASGMA